MRGIAEAEAAIRHACLMGCIFKAEAFQASCFFQTRFSKQDRVTFSTAAQLLASVRYDQWQTLLHIPAFY